jgi:L-alanine-DL-glutamate epimerase-like enolase superfamily enzyme
MREPGALAEQLAAVREQGFRAFKIGWGPFGRINSAMDEAMVRAAREAVSSDSLLMVDAGASDAFWPQDYKWAVRTAHMIADYDVYWFEEPLPPDSLRDYALLRGQSLVPIAGGEVLTRRQSFTPWLQQGGARHRTT